MCKKLWSKVKKRGQKFYQKYESVINFGAWTMALVLSFWFALWINKRETIRAYQRGFGYTKEQSEWVYDKASKLDKERAKVVGKRIGKAAMVILKLEP